MAKISQIWLKNIYEQFQETINLNNKKNKENYTTLKSTDSVKILKVSRRKKSYILRNNNRIADFLSETMQVRRKWATSLK